MAGFVGADRDRVPHVGERRIVIGGQRLLDQLDPHLRQRWSQIGEMARGPALIRVDDQPRLRRVVAHRPYPFEIAVAGQLQLEKRPTALGRRRLAHALGRVERERVGGDDRP